MILSVSRVGSFGLFFNPLLHPRVSIACIFSSELLLLPIYFATYRCQDRLPVGFSGPKHQ
jgi:hypothetical protein